MEKQKPLTTFPPALNGTHNDHLRAEWIKKKASELQEIIVRVETYVAADSKVSRAKLKAFRKMMINMYFEYNKRGPMSCPSTEKQDEEEKQAIGDGNGSQLNRIVFDRSREKSEIICLVEMHERNTQLPDGDANLVKFIGMMDAVYDRHIKSLMLGSSGASNKMLHRYNQQNPKSVTTSLSDRSRARAIVDRRSYQKLRQLNAKQMKAYGHDHAYLHDEGLFKFSKIKKNEQ